MNNVVPHPGGSLPVFRPDQLSLIRRTVAKDCNDDEFNLFISGYCQTLRLNPLKKQIFAIVYSKDDPTKRNMSVVISIDGYRVIAARTSNYRPGKITYDVDPEAKNPNSNPEGLISATAIVHQFAHGQWHEVEATAYWAEYAPLKAEGEDYEWVAIEGQFKPDGSQKYRKKQLGTITQKLPADSKWKTMPRLMLGKVAEAQALRRAWPDDFSNVYAEEEVDRSRVQEDEIMLPSAAADKGDEDSRRERAGLAPGTILIDLMESEHAPLQPVPVGQFFDKVAGFVKAHRMEPSRIRLFAERNVFGMREFWAKQPNDCKALKALIEDAVNNPPPEEGEGEDGERA